MSADGLPEVQPLGSDQSEEEYLNDETTPSTEEETTEETTDDSAEETSEESVSDEAEGEGDVESEGDSSETESTEETSSDDSLETSLEDGALDDEDDLDRLLREDEQDQEAALTEDEQYLATRVDTVKLKKDFPEVFKKHPQLKHAIYRERRFAETFPTVEEAERAASMSQNYQAIRSAMAQGNLAPLLMDMKDSPQSIAYFAQQVLPTLVQADPGLYKTAIDPAIRHLIQSGKKFAGDTKNENLDRALDHITNYVYGQPTIPEQQNMPAMSQQTQQEVAQAETGFITEAQTNITRKMKREIAANFDPKGVMPETQRRAFENQIWNDVQRLLDKDKIHSTHMRTRFSRAREGGFRQDLLPGIVSAYLGRARAILPKLYGKYRTSNSGRPKGKGKRNVKVVKQGTASSGKKSSFTPDQIDWNKTTEEEYLAGNVTLKK